MNEFTLIAGMALVTFSIRYPVLALFSKIPLPENVFRALRFVPPAVLTAIIAPALFLPHGQFSVNLDNAHLYAGLAAILIAWRSKNLLITILLGMAILWIWPYLSTLF